jgi:hypothetical protein
MRHAESFSSLVVTWAGTCIHHIEPQTKRQSLEWDHPIAPQKKKFEAIPSAGKVMDTLFGLQEG